jgi:hypothetical protein
LPSLTAPQTNGQPATDINRALVIVALLLKPVTVIADEPQSSTLGLLGATALILTTRRLGDPDNFGINRTIINTAGTGRREPSTAKTPKSATPQKLGVDKLSQSTSRSGSGLFTIVIAFIVGLGRHWDFNGSISKKYDFKRPQEIIIVALKSGLAIIFLMPSVNLTNTNYWLRGTKIINGSKTKSCRH